MSVVDELQAVDSPEALCQAAEVLDGEAETLRERAREIALEATALRRRAREIENEPPPHPLDFLNGNRPIAERALSYLKSADEPAPISSIADHVGVPANRLRGVLERLMEHDLIVRTGLKRGTRYRLRREGEQVEAPEPFGQRYEEVVRDAARRLGTFTLDELRGVVPVSDVTLYRWLGAWVDRGTLEVERVGKCNVYAVVEFKGSHPTHAPRSAPKPWEGATERGGGQASSGRRRRSGSPLVDKLIREVTPHGVTITKSAHRIEYRLDGKIVATSSRTPRASSLKDTRKELRKAGVPV